MMGHYCSYISKSECSQPRINFVVFALGTKARSSMFAFSQDGIHLLAYIDSFLIWECRVDFCEFFIAMGTYFCLNMNVRLLSGRLM
jgi:hypothetical protein